jgi:hypothetical protein
MPHKQDAQSYTVGDRLNETIYAFKIIHTGPYREQRVEEKIKLVTREKPRWMPRWFWRWMIRRVMVIQYWPHELI